MYLPYLDTCAGICGLSGGLPNKISTDFWDAPRNIYVANHPGSEYYYGEDGNLYNISLDTLNSVRKKYKLPPIERGKVGGYVSGSPCKDMSTINPDHMAFGLRNFLMLEQVRIAKDFMPEWIVWEQVPGLLTNGMTPFRELLFDVIKRDLGGDYHIELTKLNAMHYGAFQDRERMIFMLVRKDLNKRPTYPLGSQVMPCQYLSNLIPGVVSYKNGKGNWQSADRVIGTMTSGAVWVKLVDGTIRQLTVDEKKLICGFAHLNMDVPGVTNDDKHEICGNSVAYQFGLALMQHCLKEYQGIII